MLFRSGETHSYALSLIADVKETADAKYPKLPEYLQIRTPPGAETNLGPGGGPHNLMTRAERDGVGCTVLRLKQWGKGEHEFECRIPAEHIGKPVRIRAELNYQYNNVGTPWPMIRFYHDVAQEGIMQPSGTSRAEPDGTADQNGSGDQDSAPDTGKTDSPGDVAETKPSARPEISEIASLDFPDRLQGAYSTAPLLTDAGDDHNLKDDDDSVVPDQVELQNELNDLNQQIANTKDPEKRKKLNGKRNKIYQALLKYQTSSIYTNAAASTAWQSAVTLTDKILGYHPVTGPVWAVTKAMYQAAQGNWQDASVTATGMLGNISVAGKVISQTGDKISLFMDGVTIVDKLGPDWDSKPSSPGQHQTKSHGFTHHMAK